MTICRPGDVVDVPFPFIDVPEKKIRPALVLSDQHFQQASGAIILMMVTSAVRSRWDSDIELDDWQSAGLRKASILRFKIFTLDEQLVGSRRGTLSGTDQQKVRTSLHSILAFWS